MIPVFEHDEGKFDRKSHITRGTFDKTPSRPFHLGRYDYTRGRAAGPCNACAGLDAERAPTGHIRSTRRRQRHNIVVKITI
jgi:hypothetical protein